MDSDIERGIVLRDARDVETERIVGGDHAQGSNVAAVLSSNGSTVKISSLSIDLGIVKEKGGNQKCSHFSIRGYAAKMREKGGKYDLWLADCTGEEPPPMEVPHFRYWLCQSCLRDCGSENTSQEVALVSGIGKCMVQPFASSDSAPCCPGVPTLPFGEGTSGLKSADKTTVDENNITVLQGDTTQFSPDTPAANVKEPAKTDSIDANVTNDDENHSSDDLNDDPSGHPRRKARKVRLLTELLCRNTEEQQQRMETNLLKLNPEPSSPLASSQIKRKIPQALDRRSIDVTSQGHVRKKVKVSKEDAAVNSVKDSIVENSRDLQTATEDGRVIDKYQGKKHGTQRTAKSGKVGSDPVAAWRSIFSDKGRSSHEVSQERGVDPLSTTMPPSQPEKKSNGSKKLFETENPLKSHMYREDIHIRRPNIGGPRVRDRQSDNSGLGLGLSLHYDPQSRVSSLPQMPNRVHAQDQGRKTGFFCEESVAHRVTSVPQAKPRSVYEVRDGFPPRTALLQEQQHYHTQHSHGSFSQHQNLDFSNPNNTRNSGYSDVYQRRDVFSNGRSDEKEIAEHMARIQNERNLSEAQGYFVPRGCNNSGMFTSSSFHKGKFNQGMPIGPVQQYPAMRRPLINPPAFFHHQEPLPAFPSYETFSPYRNQPLNGIRVSNGGNQRQHGSNYHESRVSNNIAPRQSSPRNMQIMEACSKYRSPGQHNATPENVWSNPWSNTNKGKTVMNLDLNVTAPNIVDEHTHLEASPNDMDSSYSNEAIPAMQLLSLMDAAKSSLPMDGKQFSTSKPQFSSYYNHCSSSVISGKPNSMETRHFPYSGAQKSQHFVPDHGTSSPASSSFSSLFNYIEGCRFHKKPRGMPPAPVTHTYNRPEESFAFLGSTNPVEPRNIRMGPEVDPLCRVNQNPADFSVPGPENTYMINHEDLKYRERCYKF